jgi:hypothetical protein
MLGCEACLRDQELHDISSDVRAAVYNLVGSQPPPVGEVDNDILRRMKPTVSQPITVNHGQPPRCA